MFSLVKWNIHGVSKFTFMIRKYKHSKSESINLNCQQQTSIYISQMKTKPTVMFGIHKDVLLIISPMHKYKDTERVRGKVSFYSDFNAIQYSVVFVIFLV